MGLRVILGAGNKLDVASQCCNADVLAEEKFSEWVLECRSCHMTVYSFPSRAEMDRVLDNAQKLLEQMPNKNKP